MMGHIINLVLGMVKEDKGDEGVCRLFQEANLEKGRTYQAEVIYPEEEFQALFAATQKIYGIDSDRAEIAFSKYFMKISPRTFSWFFKLSPHARDFLEKVPQIHRNFPAAVSASYFVEKLILLKSASDHIVYRYFSPNKLCVTLRTLASLALDYYGEKGEVIETECRKKGADACLVAVHFLGSK